MRGCTCGTAGRRRCMGFTCWKSRLNFYRNLFTVMTLRGALSLGASSLAAQQTGLQVTGNNIANAGTEGYSRQTVELTPASPVKIGGGQYVGSGVNVASISRQANETINQSLRDATSNQNAAQT